MIVQKTNRLFSDYVFSISVVQDYCFPGMLLRKNPFTNEKYHRISNNLVERGRNELLAVLAQASGKTQGKVTSAQILRL